MDLPIEHFDSRDAEILLTLAKCRMNVSETARQMYMHRNTVQYHLNKVYRLTGKNPLDFYQLHDLVRLARKIVGGDFL